MRSKTGLYTLLGAILVALLLSFSPAKADTQAWREREVWNTAATTGTDILATSLTPLKRGTINTTSTSSCTYRFMVALASGAADSVVYLRITQVGGTSANFSINTGTALTNGSVYTYVFNATSGFTYNFRVGTNTTIGILTVDRCTDTGAN